jgi:acyl-CoA synthetase (AMP-forming)/AMP-acid ligase II
MGMRDYTLYDYFRHNASAASSAPAVIGGSKTLTHRQLLERVDQLSAGLDERGVNKGDRICILAQNSIEYLVLYGACAKTGAIAYPINWRLSPEEIKTVVELADPKMIAVEGSHLPQLLDEVIDRVELRALIGPGSAERFFPLGDLYQTAQDKRFEVQSGDPFVIISTAAVAGKPRGAVLTHANLVLAGYLLINALGLSVEDRNLAALPFFHVSGLGLALAMTQVGGANVMLEKFDPAEATQAIEQHNVTLMADFPPILSMLLEARAATGENWDSLQYVVGLEAPKVIQRLYAETKAKFWTGFGQSETCGVGTLVRVDKKPGATGLPLPLLRMRCVDDLGRQVPDGKTGEIVMQGPVVFAGYWRDPDATQFTFRDGWHHTGDLGKFDPQGYLYYVGRKPEKELIKPGGENVYPAEVEQVIREMPGVAAVCVIGVADEKWGEAVKAVVELAPGTSLSAEQVSSQVAKRIASYKKPRHVVFVNQLPRTTEGEVDRQAIKAQHGDA